LDYPRYEKKEPIFEFPGGATVPKEIKPLIEQIPWPKTGSITHKFQTRDEGRFISLTEDFIALSESKYKTWDYFHGEMERIEQAVKDIYGPSLYSRIGLRYRNIIRPESLGLETVKWSELLEPHIIGELVDLNVRDAITDIKTRCVIKISEIPGARVILNHGLIKESQDSPVSYLIDADFAVDNMEVANGLFNVLGTFNKLAGRLFRWAITETLHDAMGPEHP